MCSQIWIECSSNECKRSDLKGHILLWVFRAPITLPWFCTCIFDNEWSVWNWMRLLWIQDVISERVNMLDLPLSPFHARADRWIAVSWETFGHNRSMLKCFRVQPVTPQTPYINLHNVTHSLISWNPREGMFVVWISLLISQNLSLMHIVKEVKPTPSPVIGEIFGHNRLRS